MWRVGLAVTQTVTHRVSKPKGRLLCVAYVGRAQYLMYWMMVGYGHCTVLWGRWCERVLSEGVAHRPAENVWFENGGFGGTRLMLSLTTNGRPETYAHNGRHGSLDIILWPIANALRFSGFDLVEPFAAFDVVRASDSERREILERAAHRARSVLDLDLMPFHALTDYGANGVLKDDVQAATPGQQRPDRLVPK